MSSAAPLHAHVLPLPREPAGVTPALLRRAMGHFATGVTVVTARDRAGAAFGTTANAVTSVSLDPPLVLVCLGHESQTLGAIRDAGRFAVNVLRADQRHLSDRFARSTRPETWTGVAHRLAGVPVLEANLATLECVVHEDADAGDHAIVIGRVIAADHPDDPRSDPLLFYRGSYGGLEASAPPVHAAAEGTRVDAALPSSLGALRILALAHEDEDDQVRVAVTVGEPRGRAGALLYLHRGCLVGDVVGGTACRGQERMRAALDLMSADEPGVIVYHRDREGLGRCCLAAPPHLHPPSEAETTSVRRAVRALGLTHARLIARPGDARVLIEAGVPVGEVLEPPVT